MIFIASPLFNAPQHLVLDKIESSITQRGWSFYSARHHAPPLKDASDPKQRQETFKSNVSGLFRCDRMIAVLDYLLPNGEPSGFPDSGTVWEVGFASALGYPIVGHYVKRPQRPNLMLADSCRGLIIGSDELERFFQEVAYSKWEVPNWDGEVE